MRVLAAALIAVILWGASPVAAKIAVSSLSPMMVAILRTVIGGLVALPLAILLRIPLPTDPSQRRLLALSGFCGFVAFPILFTLGVLHTSANHASMILASLPVFTGLIAMTWDKKRPGRAWWIGCTIAMIGEVLLIFGQGLGSETGASIGGDLLILASNGFASLGYVAGGRLERGGYSAMGTTFYGVGLYALVLLPLLFIVDPGTVMLAVPTGIWMAIAYLAVGVTIVGYVLWYWALGRGGIARIALLQFLQPVSGVILAAILLGEHFGAEFIAASGVILFGVWYALRANR
jgi:drug/metabolite transporter (DMT)-like permease